MNGRGPQKLGVGKEGSVSRKSVAFLTPRFQTSSLKNCERVHFCYVKPRTLWSYAMAELGNNTVGKQEGGIGVTVGFSNSWEQEGEIKIANRATTVCEV